MNIINFFHVFKFEQPLKIVHFLYTFVPRNVLDSGWGAPKNLSFRDFQLGPRLRSGHVDDVFFQYFNRLDVFDRVLNTFQRDVDMFEYGGDVERLRRQLIERLSST